MQEGGSNGIVGKRQLASSASGLADVDAPKAIERAQLFQLANQRTQRTQNRTSNNAARLWLSIG
jgi:hypothetical protein